jgi:hypothetical protein
MLAGSPSFRCLIAHVVALQADKQMVRINACGVIAMVQNTKASRDISLVDFVANAMG